MSIPAYGPIALILILLLLLLLIMWYRERRAKRALRLQLINIIARQETIEEKPPDAAAGQEPEDAWLEQLRETVRQNLRSPQFNVDHLAELMGISRTGLYELVHERAGVSANQFIQEMRLFHARELLESGQYTNLRQVAQSIGFRSTDYFSRLYRLRFGVSPADYFHKVKAGV